MGMLEPNSIVGFINGKIGNLVLVRTQDGRVIVRERPSRQAPFTPGELTNQSRFRRAAAYVKRIHQTADDYAVYQAAAALKGKRACDLAIKDFCSAPQIMDVDLTECTGAAGQRVRIQAVDDFGVNSIAVTVSRLDGTVVEHGVAAPAPSSSDWVYVTQTAMSPGQTLVIRVTALDRPGNVVARTFHHALPPFS